MSRAKGAALNRKETEMAQFKKAKFYTIGSNGDGKQVYLRDGYTFEKHGLTWGIYKTPDSNPKNLWWIIDLQSGLSIPCGFIKAFKSRNEALDMFGEQEFAKVEQAFAHSGYAKAVEEFKQLITAERSDEDVAQAEHVRVEVPQPAEEVTEEAVEEVIEDAPADEAPAEPQPAGVTEHNIWFAEKVDGASEYKGKRKKHQGMWWLPNTPANRERFGIAAA